MNGINDFLSSIAARALKTIPVVTPRPVSRFEPEVSGRATVAEFVTETERASPRPRPEEHFSAGSMANAAPANSPFNSPAVSPTAASAARAASEGSRLDVPAASRPAREAAADRPMTAKDGARTLANGLPKRESGIERERLSQPPRPSQPQRNGAPWPQARESAPSIHISIGRVEVRAIHRAEKPPATPAAPEPPRRSLGDYLRARRD